MTTFNSIFRHLGTTALPAFSSTRVMMMPIILGDLRSVPAKLHHYKNTLRDLFTRCEEHEGKTGYLTVDEKVVDLGMTHRRKGLHVDGVFKVGGAGWGGTGSGWGGTSSFPKENDLREIDIYGEHAPFSGGWGGGSWGSTGLLTVASSVGCKAYNQKFVGQPEDEGGCDHLKSQCKQESAETLKPNNVYWLDGMCVHESLPQQQTTDRQFVRLSMPSTAPWFEGYTENPLGIKPTGHILPGRKFMNI